MQRHGFRTGTKIILWTLFIIQLLLIGIFWALQGVGEDSAINGESFTVNFISSEKIHNSTALRLRPNTLMIYNEIEVKPISNFSVDFITFPESGIDYSENLTCFRLGIVEDLLDGDRQHIKKCRCLPDWHGVDCGQPEVIWRAFMTSKVPLAVSVARTEPHKVVYLITGNFFSLELLEIQVMQMRNSVDFFIICNRKPKRLKLNFANTFHDRILIIESNHKVGSNCTPKLAYKEFKSRVGEKAVSVNDIFIFSNEDELLNDRAIKYLKYYSFPGVIRFRLKYNVYGFYWQHPESTRLGSAGSTIAHLEKNFKSDPERLLAVRKPSIIIGDLNHIGGWYCQFCYQPSEIIERLQVDSHSVFPKSAKNRQIDAKYIQNLIASGLYVDGKLGLNKLHRFADKYYAPAYVEQNGWKFDNILVNLFLSFDDDEYEN